MAIIVNAASPAHEAQIRIMADALDLASVTYEDHDNKEIYILETRSGRKIALHACGNSVDGGFLSIRKIEDGG